ncbi:hypothetical protein [Chamaesiphon sp.]|uniref:hypothetical protein n=1 Tax=Chamaesiphon sp. TaxID=2814140 RepID=UPI003593B0CF
MLLLQETRGNVRGDANDATKIVLSIQYQTSFSKSRTRSGALISGAAPIVATVRA